MKLVVQKTTTINRKWGKRRSKMEKHIYLFTNVVFLISIIVDHGMAQKINSTPHEEKSLFWKIIRRRSPSQTEFDKVCLTPECIHTASRILRYIDETVDPCDDFYQFSCGTFLKNAFIPEEKAIIDEFSTITDNNNNNNNNMSLFKSIDIMDERLKSILDEPVNETEPKPFKLAKKFYKTCINKTLIEEDDKSTINEIIKQLGGWPAVEGNEWNEHEFDWKKSVYKLKRNGYGFNNFISTKVSSDPKNSTRNIIILGEASLGLGREYLIKGFEHQIVKAYYMVDVSVLFGADRDIASRDLKKSLEFEMKLANISLPREKFRNKTALYNLFSIEQLQEKFPSIRWKEYINNLFEPETQVQPGELVVVEVPSFLKSFERLVNATPKRVLANYVLWRTVYYAVPYLTESFRKKSLDYISVKYGTKGEEPRWKTCTKITSGRFNFALSALYIRKYFNEEKRQHAADIVKDIKSQYEDTLKIVDWMDEETRKNAIDKLKSMTAMIAYALDDNKLIEYYDGLEIDSRKYLKSVLNNKIFETKKRIFRLREPYNKTFDHNKTDWKTGYYIDVNARYSPLNLFQICAGILQGAFFNINRPKYMNYGAIGNVIGHEITHGFDDQCSQYDKYGNLVDWWKADTKKRYAAKAQCIINQYANYTVPEIGLRLNGINTQAENIADNGGTKLAYLAYERWIKRNNEEKSLPGLNFTPRQLFWISAASIHCNKIRKELLEEHVITNPHSPGKFRILGSFSNMEIFSKDFNCPLGAPMNPIHKCHFW